jgi:hypothetical protein
MFLRRGLIQIKSDFDQEIATELQGAASAPDLANCNAALVTRSLAEIAVQ